MALVDSLLTAMVRARGDALVMHVGERPYVVAEAGTVDLSTHGLNIEAMTGMLAQLLPGDAQNALLEFGAVEHQLPSREGDRFTVVAARGGDDIWIEIRRRRGSGAPTASVTPPAPAPPPVVAAAPVPASVPAAAAPAIAPVAPVVPELPAPIVVEPVFAAEAPLLVAAAAPAAEPVIEPVPAVAEPAPEPPAILELTPVVVEVAPEPPPVVEPLPLTAPVAPEPFRPLEEPAYVAAPEIAEDDDRFVIDEPMVAEAPEVVGRQHTASFASEPPASAREEPSELRRGLAEAVSGREGGPEVPGPLAPVLPMTRTVRIEVPPRVSPARMAGVERLLRIAAARGASSLFLTAGSRPYLRVEGDIRLLETEPVQTKADVEASVLEIGPENARELVGQGHGEWVVELPDVGRVRCTTFADHHGPGALFTMIATRAATAEHLGLAREVQALATEAEGLVLVAGSRGSGKSTLMSALVDLVNRQRAEYVITLERQIRLVHENRLALVSQREIRGGADEVLGAARAALRENPDVLVVEDLSSAQMVPLLLEAAGQGLLVIASITAPSTTDAVARLVDLAPPESRKAVQAAMAETFRGAVAQVLLKKTGGGRVAAREVLLGTAGITRLIADGQFAQLPLALESGRKHGMMPLIDAMLGLVQSGVVDIREAFRKTHDRERLLAGLKRQGIDTSVVERLA